MWTQYYFCSINGVGLTYLLRVYPSLVGEAFFSEGLPHFGDHLGDLYGIGSQLCRLQLMVGNVRPSSNTLQHEQNKSVKRMN